MNDLVIGDLVSATFVCGHGTRTVHQGVFQAYFELGQPAKKYALVRVSEGCMIMVLVENIVRG